MQFQNTGNKSGKYASDIHFIWLRPDGWKDSWMNVIDKGSLKVNAHSRKTWYADFGADPTKLIVACGLKIGNSEYVHRIKVIPLG